MLRARGSIRTSARVPRTRVYTHVSTHVSLPRRTRASAQDRQHFMVTVMAHAWACLYTCRWRIGRVRCKAETIATKQRHQKAQLLIKHSHYNTQLLQNTVIINHGHYQTRSLQNTVTTEHRCCKTRSLQSAVINKYIFIEHSYYRTPFVTSFSLKPPHLLWSPVVVQRHVDRCRCTRHPCAY